MEKKGPSGASASAKRPAPSAESREKQRRRFPRFRADFPVRLTLLGHEGYVDLRGRCTELSQGGMGCVISNELALGEIVSASLSLSPASEPMVLRAVVRRRTGLSHGLEFVGATASQNEQIQMYCRNLEPS